MHSNPIPWCTPIRHFVIALMATFVLIPAFGQGTAGSITGTVQDSSGAVVPSAKVTIASPAIGFVSTVQSNDQGLFVAPEIPPGIYTISVEKDGFRKLIQDGVRLSPQDRLTLGELVLQVGQTADSVTVSADAGQLQLKADSGERSDVVTGGQLRQLALNGRNPHDLAKTLPGVYSSGAGAVMSNGGLSSYAINGVRGTSKALSIDGTDVGRSDNGVQQVTINPDAIGEIKILTSNYQAEYGKAGGGFVSFTTKEGTREFHGSARWFHRHDSLNANNFFNNAYTRPRNLYRYNYYGYDIGGPVYIPGKFNRDKNKLFFFWSQEYYKQLVPQAAVNLRVPTAEERGGDFSKTVDGSGKPMIVRDTRNALGNGINSPFPGNIIPKSAWYQSGQAILNVLPVPNTAAGGNVFNYTSQVPSEYPRREDIVRTDWNVSSSTHVSGRYIHNFDEQRLTYGTTALSFNWPVTKAIRPNKGNNVSITVLHNFGPTLINEAIFGRGLLAIRIYPSDNAISRATTGVNTPLLYPDAIADADIMPSLAFGSIVNQTLPNLALNGAPFTQDQSTYNFADNLTKVAGRHMIKAGFSLYKNNDHRTTFGPVQSNLDFSSELGNNANFPLDAGNPFANALTGIFRVYQQANQKINTNYHFRNVEWYVQDTFRTSSHLTIDYGVRFTFFQPSRDEALLSSYFSPSAFDSSKAVRLYTPVLVGAERRAFDPGAPPDTPTTANTLPGNYIGLIVPNSGSITNGLITAASGVPAGGYQQGVRAAPRLGFAYDPFASGKTVLRGGFAVSYDRGNPNSSLNPMTDPPNILTPQVYFGDLRTISPTSAVRGVPAVYGYAQESKTPAILSYSLGVQRNIGGGTVVDVAYVGTQGRHLELSRNLNAIPYQTTFKVAAQDASLYSNNAVPASEPGLPASYSAAGLAFSGKNALPVDFLRPFRGYGDITYYEFVGTSNYNSLQISVNRRWSKGLTFGVAYTLSKVFSTANNDMDAVNPFNTRAYEYRLASYDVPQNLVVNYVYDVPGLSKHAGNSKLARALLDGWQISGITSFISGTPTELSLAVSGINAGQRLTGSYTNAPMVYLKGDPATGQEREGLQVDPNAFYAAGPSAIAPWPRTYLRNPGVNNWDISVFKNFPFSADGKRSLQLRAETFNTWNHAQFSGLNLATNLTTSTGATGANVFNDPNFASFSITNNVRPAGANRPLGFYFGEYNAARDPRILQLAVKLYF